MYKRQGYTNELNIGDVISLSPGPGEQVPAGTTITLTINTQSASGGDTNWVCYSPLTEPEAYNGGSVRLELCLLYTSNRMFWFRRKKLPV